jgi:hypothetical protein
MLERVYDRCAICLVYPLALLIAVLTSPLVPSRMGSKSFQMLYLVQHHNTPAAPPLRHCFRSNADGHTPDTAEFGREAENDDEEEFFAEVTGSVSFLIGPPLSTSLRRPAKQTKAFDLMKSSPILRC